MDLASRYSQIVESFNSVTEVIATSSDEISENDFEVQKLQILASTRDILIRNHIFSFKIYPNRRFCLDFILKIFQNEFEVTTPQVMNHRFELPDFRLDADSISAQEDEHRPRTPAIHAAQVFSAAVREDRKQVEEKFP